MPSQTNEAALEATIEKYLTGTSLEENKTQSLTHSDAEDTPSVASDLAMTYRSGKGYFVGSPNDFNAKYAIDETRFWDFLERTQADELAKLQKQSDWKLKILERLDRMVKKYGILRL